MEKRGRTHKTAQRAFGPLMQIAKPVDDPVVVGLVAVVVWNAFTANVDRLPLGDQALQPAVKTFERFVSGCKVGMGPHVFVQTGIVRVERHAGGRSEEIFSVRLDDTLGLDKFAQRCSDVFDLETDDAGDSLGRRMLLDRQPMHDKVRLADRHVRVSGDCPGTVSGVWRAITRSRTARRRILLAEDFGSSGQISTPLGRL